MAKKNIIKTKEEKSKPQTQGNPDEKLFSKINKSVEASIGATSAWSSNQDKWHKLRMRIKKTKTFPFVGSSNIRMPTAETKIRKLKAALVNTIFGIRPICQVVPSPSGDPQTAMKIEKFLDHLLCNVMDTKLKSIIAIDQELEKGFYLLKPYWRTEVTVRKEKFKLADMTDEQREILLSPQTSYDQAKQLALEFFEADKSERVQRENEAEIERGLKEMMAGKEEVELELQDVIYDAPDIALCSPERVYVPTDGGYDVQSLQWIAHEFFLPLNQVKANVKYKEWNKKAIEDIELSKSSDISKLTDRDKDMREGIERLNNPSGQVKIWEYYGWEDLNGDGVDEKCLITIAPDFKKILRKIALPFDNGLFPFVKLTYELMDDRWFAHRGVPEMIEDIIKEIDVQHMQKLDQQTIRNTPMFMYRAGMINPNLIQFMPNQAIPVNGMSPLRDTIDVLNNSNPSVEYSYEKEQMILESKIEELIGQVDFSLQSMINKRQPRTLGEVQMQGQSMQMVFSLDADIHNSGFSKLFSFVWDLWCQYGNDDYEFAYFGENGAEKIRMSREEVQGKYRIVVRGNDQNTNPQVKLQKAQAIQMATTNQMYIQAGVVTPMNMAEGLKRFYQTLDIQGWESLVNMNIQPPQPPQRPPAAALIKAKFEDLTDAEQAQVIASAGVQPDAQGRALEAQDDNQRIAMEQANMEHGQGKDLAEFMLKALPQLDPNAPVEGEVAQ